MSNLAVMYHYVRERGDWNGIVPLSPKDFEAQIEYLSQIYEIISVDQIHNRSSPRPWCVLTFDDGTKDQYTNAFEILKRKGIPAYFTVMSGPQIEGRIPLVHLVHTVLSFNSDEEIWERLSQQYDTNGIEEESSFYHYEQNKYRRYNKFMLNFKLPANEAIHFLECMFKLLFPDKVAFINDFYLDHHEIVQMSQAGMTIGVHCHKHAPYNGDAQGFYDNEIEPCKKWLKQIIGTDPCWYTPAFGGGIRQESMREELLPILIKNGFKGAFTITPNSIPNNPGFWMDRLDCNKIPPLKDKIIL